MCGMILIVEFSANDFENAQEIKANAYALLSTLVEQSNMLSEFYDKVCKKTWNVLCTHKYK